jgi:hypothetical protein
MPYRASLGLFCHLLNSITSGIGISGRDPLPFLPQGGAVDTRAILIMEFSLMKPKTFCANQISHDPNTAQ